MYYTLRPNFTPKCPAYYTLIVKRVNRSALGFKEFSFINVHQIMIGIEYCFLPVPFDDLDFLSD